MKLFFINWARKDLGLVEVVKNLKKSGNEIVYWTSFLNEIDKEDFPGTIFHEHLDALEGIPAPALRHEEFDPPDVALLHSMLEAEATVMTMMNKHFEGTSTEERKRFYFNYVRYWNGVIQKYRPDAIIFPTTPHVNYDFVIYSLAKLYHIKTIMFDMTWISDRYLSINDYKEGSLLLKEEFKKNKDRNFSMADLNEDIRKYYEKQLNPAIDATPLYTKEFIRTYKGLNLVTIKLKMRMILKSIINFTILEKSFGYVLDKFKENPIKEYLKVQINPDFNKKFVYVPLSLQPEQTTCPLGDVYVDQILMVETLAAALPDGWIIYVKEHPAQWLKRGLKFFSYRYRGFYKRIAGLKKVFIVPIQTNSYKLIENAQAVAAVTGTPGWEGILRSKPALIFGYPWYMHAPGVFRINSVESCNQIFKKVAKEFKIEQREIINFLVSLDRVSMHGFMEGFVRRISLVSKEENVENFFNALASQINGK